MTLEASALDHGRTSENPLLEKLKEIIISTYAEEPNMRAIVFVRTRIMTECLVSWMEDNEELQHIKAQKYTGAKASISEGGKLFITFTNRQMSSLLNNVAKYILERNFEWNKFDNLSCIFLFMHVYNFPLFISCISINIFFKTSLSLSFNTSVYENKFITFHYQC